MTLINVVNTASLLGGAEIAQFGYWMRSAGDEELSDFIGSEEDNFSALFWETARSHLPDTTVLASRVASEVNADTGVVIASAALAMPLHPQGASPAVSLPTEVAEVITLYTARAGASGRGRMYFPPLSLDGVQAGARVKAAAATELTGFASYLSAMAAGTLPWTGVVYSRTLAGTFPIISVSVGDVFDAQRRRRNKLAEVRVHADVG